MKERPILFSTPMVQAILAGNKTQTRRVIKGMALTWLIPDGFTHEFVASLENHLCPYGYSGDVLWVRETWQHTKYLGINEEDENSGFIYRATDNGKAWEDNTEEWKWKPSIFMPRSACRILLEIINVRIERLQDISEEDAIAEGCIRNNKPHEGWCWLENTYATDSPEFAYKLLWKHIHGENSWNENPFVWVIEFKIKDIKK